MTTYRQTVSLQAIAFSQQTPTFLLTWLAIYPLITIILHFCGAFLSLLPLPIRTLILTGTVVYLMTYWAMPMLIKLFRNWLK